MRTFFFNSFFSLFFPKNLTLLQIGLNQTSNNSLQNIFIDSLASEQYLTLCLKVTEVQVIDWLRSEAIDVTRSKFRKNQKILGSYLPIRFF